MKPKTMMIFGALMASLSIVAATILHDSFSLVFCAALGGAVFGKGYGIWETNHDR